MTKTTQINFTHIESSNYNETILYYNMTHYRSIRQSPYWQNYLESIGWETERVQDIYVYVRRLPYTPYSVIKIQEPTTQLPFENINQISQNHRALFVVIEPSNTQQEEKLVRNGYELYRASLTPTATIQIDLEKPFSEIVINFSSSTRRNIRKAKMQGVNIRIGNLDADSLLETAMASYELVNFTANSRRFRNLPFTEYLNKMYALGDISTVLFAFADGFVA